MNVLRKIALVFVIIGALNWGLIGLFDFNLVGFLFDDFSETISRIIYVIVGLSGLISIVTLFMPFEETHYHTINHA